MEDVTQLLLSQKVRNAIMMREVVKLILLFIDDKDSIKVLTEETARCFDHEQVRMLMKFDDGLIVHL